MWISDRETAGKAVEKTAPQSHVVETPEGSFRRNRQHIVRLPQTGTGSESDREEQSEPTNRRETRSRAG